MGLRTYMPRLVFILAQAQALEFPKPSCFILKSSVAQKKKIVLTLLNFSFVSRIKVLVLTKKS